MKSAEDQIAVRIKQAVALGRERGYLTHEELDAALPQDLVSSEQIEDVMSMLSELGISVVEPVLRARPMKGKIDYAELSREHIARYPKIRARLAE